MPSKKRVAQMTRDRQRTHIAPQRYAASGIPCSVDNATGRVVAEELRMKLVSVPVEDPHAVLHDRYYASKRENPYDQALHR